MPPTAPAKKPASKKPAAKNTPPKAKAEPKPPAKGHKPKEIDPKKLTGDEAKKRAGSIYALQRKVETKRHSFELAKKAYKGAKTALDDAEAALAKEIHEQRYGPGPLFPVE